MSQAMWTAATVIAVLGVVLFGMILLKLHKQIKKQDETYQPLQLRFRYAASDAYDAPADRRFSWLFALMLFYAALAMAVVAHNAAAAAWLRHAMYAFTGLACFAGLAETLLLLARKAKAASACGLIKWGFFALWTACMFLGLFLRGWAL